MGSHEDKVKFECGDCGCYYWVNDRNNFVCPNCEDKKVCLGCGSNNLMEYEDIGEGKFCEDCFNKEMEIWKKESGFYNE